MKTRAERQLVADETKENCSVNRLTGDLGTKVLFLILDDYVETGSVYLGKELRIVGNSTPALRASAPCKYIVNLYNDPAKSDTVIIRANEPGTN